MSYNINVADIKRWKKSKECIKWVSQRGSAYAQMLTIWGLATCKRRAENNSKIFCADRFF